MYETLTCCQGTIPSNSICFNLSIKNLKKIFRGNITMSLQNFISYRLKRLRRHFC